MLVYQDPELPSSRIRILQMAPHLEARGIECELIRWPRALAEKLQLRARARKAGVVLLQKKLPTLLDAQIFSGATLAFDYDDAIMFRARAKNGSFDSRARRIRFNRIARMSRGLVAGNRYLREQTSHERVLIAPSPVPDQVPKKQHRDSGRVRIGWVGLAKNLPALDALRPVFFALAPRIQLTVISNEPYRATGLSVEHVPWSLATQDEEVAKLDVGIMPLDSNSPFTRGKCSYKLLQYMAAGLPCVASPVGMNAEVIRPGDNGFLASTPEEWIAAISRLASSVDLRRAMGEAGRSQIEASFTYATVADRLAEFLKSL